MPHRIKSPLIRFAPLITAIAMVPVSLHFASAALHAGMVTLLMSDQVSPSLFAFYIPAYLGCWYAASYLALTSNECKPNWWACAAIILPIPAFDALHNLLTTTLNGPYLYAYLVLVTGYTLLVMLVMVALRIRTHFAHSAMPQNNRFVAALKPQNPRTIQ
ncbi:MULTISPECIES: hypothetical protein [Pseudomonas]|uniref:Transmembrane protein n=1 Tax=Pseudomonas fluorescens TaxID=294 RepID=A0A166QQ09_PSEFL|nr:MULTISPECIES: hypothetical protein [Pseudomonas]KZN20664.1 hypothetical protein A1D17_03740 [Pseudomonas fluorescens]